MTPLASLGSPHGKPSLSPPSCGQCFLPLPLMPHCSFHFPIELSTPALSNSSLLKEHQFSSCPPAHTHFMTPPIKIPNTAAEYRCAGWALLSGFGSPQRVERNCNHLFSHCAVRLEQGCPCLGGQHQVCCPSVCLPSQVHLEWPLFSNICTKVLGGLTVA
jgi:hypothetical protein